MNKKAFLKISDAQVISYWLNAKKFKGNVFFFQNKVITVQCKVPYWVYIYYKIDN